MKSKKELLDIVIRGSTDGANSWEREAAEEAQDKLYDREGVSALKWFVIGFIILCVLMALSNTKSSEDPEIPINKIEESW